MPTEPIMFCLDCGQPLNKSAAPAACPQCGRAYDPADANTFAINRGQLVKLYASGNQFDVYLLRDMLAEEGIKSVVMGDALATARGELPMTVETMPALWIGQEDVEKAMQVAGEYDRVKKEGPGDVAGHGAWRCAQCGEESEGHFTACWNCGALKLGIM